MIKAPRLKLDVDLGTHRLVFGKKTYIMGILNITPDSFSDGGKFFEKDEAVKQAMKMAAEGADIIDIGGESTRPGALDISAEEELDRVMPVVEAMAGKKDLLVSIDTRKAKVARQAVEAGAKIINDVSGLKHDQEMARVAAESGVAVIIMHMNGTPRDMQKDPVYGDVVAEIIKGLEESITMARRSHISEERIFIDPGIGFGKTVNHNLEILRRLDEFKSLNKAICVGVSRKSFIGQVLHLSNAGDRLPGTIAANAVAVMKGANILRVHDVKEAEYAARLVDAILAVKEN